MPPTPVINSTEIHLFLTDDEITLEYDDRVLLRFIADNPALIPSLENTGEYVRDTATVFIVDDDCKKCKQYCERSVHALFHCSVGGPL